MQTPFHFPHRPRLEIPILHREGTCGGEEGFRVVREAFREGDEEVVPWEVGLGRFLDLAAVFVFVLVKDVGDVMCAGAGTYGQFGGVRGAVNDFVADHGYANVAELVGG